MLSLLGHPNINPAVVRQMHRRYPAHVSAAIAANSADAAREVYLMAEALPATQTTLALEERGWCLSGALYEANDLIVCYKGIAVHVLKCLSSCEAVRIKHLLKLCGGSRDSPVHKNIVQLLEFPSHLAAAAATDTPEGTSQRHKHYMVMPKLPSTLAPIPRLADEHVIQLWDDISGALQFLHDHGLACMDVKPSNICVTDGPKKDFVLIDLGSVSAFGQRAPTTYAFMPCDVDAQNPKASADHDWWMLGMTLAEKGCWESGLEMGSSGTNVSKIRLIEHLSKHLTPRVLQLWKAKLQL